jgi:multidrug efflux pump subunit AcrB
LKAKRFFDGVLQQWRLVLVVSLTMTLLGVLAVFSMARQEDPDLADNMGFIRAPLPGASAEDVERLVLEHVENALSHVDGIETIASEARQGVALINLELRPDHDAEAEWDEIEQSLRGVQSLLPEGTPAPTLDRSLNETEGIILCLTGAELISLHEAARSLRRTLIRDEDVARVELVGAPREAVVVRYADAAAKRLGVTGGDLAAQLQTKSTALPAGQVNVGDRTLAITHSSEFRSSDDVSATPFATASGQVVRLDNVAQVRREAIEERDARFYCNGSRAIGLAVVPRPNINIVDFGARFRAIVDESRDALNGIEINEVTFQPEFVASSLSGLSNALIGGCCTVAIVVMLFMGVRMGTLVSGLVPIVAAAALGFYFISGGVLHQVSIATLVLSLGMLVDNAIVMTEDMQRRIDLGIPPRDAAFDSVRTLWFPLLTATGTTIAAFVPMLLSEGPTANFTRALPVVMMITLTISLVFALSVTPILGIRWLRPRKLGEVDMFKLLGHWVGALAVRRRGLVLLVAAGLVAMTFARAGEVKQDFFPAAERPYVLVNIDLPDGTSIEHTDQTAQRLGAALAEDPRVAAISTLVGRATPRFYYNLLPRPDSPNFAQLVIEATQQAEVPGLMLDVRKVATEVIPSAVVIVRRLQQGPPSIAPLDIRVYASNRDVLYDSVEKVMAAARSDDSIRDVRHSMGTGAPTLHVTLDSNAIARRGGRDDQVVNSLLGASRGFSAGIVRDDDLLVPVIVQGKGGTATYGDLSSVQVRIQDGTVPTDQVTSFDIRWRPATIEHRQRERMAHVFASLSEGVPFGEVLPRLRETIDELDLPPEVRVEIAGESEGSQKANQSLARTLPVGLLLLVAILLLQFNSFSRVGVVLLTVPLAAVGIIPGLLVAGQPFGFMALLGVCALVGIVVNNAILLIDTLAMLERAGVPDPVARTVALRLRPVFLTTGTTIVGLIPLALSGSSLWPPLAWPVISGLISSTGLTLLVVPALCSLMRRQPPSETAEAGEDQSELG